MELIYLIIICVLLIAVAVMGCLLVKYGDVKLRDLKKSNVTIVINGNEVTMRLNKKEIRVISDVVAQYTYSYDAETIFIKR